MFRTKSAICLKCKNVCLYGKRSLEGNVYADVNGFGVVITYVHKILIEWTSAELINKNFLKIRLNPNGYSLELMHKLK
jgi:hypothetical protein